jgi:hypothetical protein
MALITINEPETPSQNPKAKSDRLSLKILLKENTAQPITK